MESNRVTPENITELKPNEVFVFGSNEQGIHGSGAARAAKNFGAIRGYGWGRMGQTFAIPTKSTPYKTLPLDKIQNYISQFKNQVHPVTDDTVYIITKIGCGLAGYKVCDIAPMFKWAANNPSFSLPQEFYDFY